MPLVDLSTQIDQPITSVKDAVALCQVASEVIEDAAVALGLHAKARLKDGQGELSMRLMVSPPIRARAID